MVHGDVRRKGAPSGAQEPPAAPGAGELGWDDSLYGGKGVPVQRDGEAAQPDGEPDGESAADTGTDTATDTDTATATATATAAPDDTMPLTAQSPGGPGGADGTGKGGGGDQPRRRRRALRWSAIVLAVVILGTAGGGYLYYEHLNANIKKEDLNIGDAKSRAAKATPNAAGQTPLNILLIGSDARDTKENQELGGAKATFGGSARADVQMLLHVSADRTNMSVVSMPRDTLVDIPKCTDPDTGKVYAASSYPTITNDSLGRGGPGCTVATWEKLTGIHIDHFMMVDFSGVVSMADAIGGVPVCVDANVYSHTSSGKGSGLKLKKGTTSVKGVQALQWLRTRYGFEDDTDIARTKAQHMYMNSMVRELRANATLTNPNALRKLAETATKALTVDTGLGTVAKLYDLSKDLKKVPTKRITMTTMPWEYSASQSGRVVPKPGDAAKLFRLVREDIALDGKDKKKTTASASPTATVAAADPDDKIAVQVQNGTRSAAAAAETGRAAAVTQVLTGKGFTSARADSSTILSEAKTVVRYPSADLEGDAQAVAKALGIPTSQVKKSTAVSGVTLVVGADWRTGTAYKAAAEDDDKTPDSADALNGSDTTACMHVDPNYTW
ncbi:cell envelope-related transcriptional attenuator [Actinobacteria bacterium OK074]|nr:cell envelope-related transcriptional attenuator [Actinobacteria bacterium OK074]